MGGAWHAHLIVSGAPSHFMQYETLVEPILSLYTYNAQVQSLIFWVQFDLLQIFLCVQLPRSADWFVPKEHCSSGVISMRGQ